MTVIAAAHSAPPFSYVVDATLTARTRQCVSVNMYRKTQMKQNLWTDVRTTLYKSGGWHKLNKIKGFLM